MVDFVRDMTSVKFCKYGEYGSFQQLLLLLLFTDELRGGLATPIWRRTILYSLWTGSLSKWLLPVLCLLTSNMVTNMEVVFHRNSEAVVASLLVSSFYSFFFLYKKVKHCVFRDGNRFLAVLYDLGYDPSKQSIARNRSFFFCIDGDHWVWCAYGSSPLTYLSCLLQSYTSSWMLCWVETFCQL